MGKTPEEEAHIMMLCEEAHDLRFKLSAVCYGPNGDSATERKHFVDKILSDYLKRLDTYLGKYKGKFIVGDQLTVADFQVFDYLDACLCLDNEDTIIDKYPHVKQFLNRIRELPELKDYIAKTQAEVPINNKG